MKFVIDMNLSPSWVQAFIEQGWDAVHWSTIGAVSASDEEIMVWAKENDHIVFTHDLDFGTILAATKAKSPSVIQVRTQDTAPDTLKSFLFAAVSQYQHLLQSGALIIIDQRKSRARILPLDS
jgi:predicted nuclease of predicted toxin-antitoxin system